MLTDIFSAFDPATSTMFSISPMIFWILPLGMLFMMISSYWVHSSSYPIIFFMPLSFMNNQLTRSKSFILKGVSSLLGPLFLFLIMMNLIGLMPYIFSHTSHLLMTLTFGLPLWLSLILSSLVNSPSEFSASLLPSGAPGWLAPALVIIETISIMVRPLTLSFRLAANMSAGHIVLGLINMYAAGAITIISPSFISLLIISISYTMFEVGICMVQAYIFCLLLSLYADDHTS